jgi:MarR family transcriptional regulator, organic hydroperoxide resistance regulator
VSAKQLSEGGLLLAKVHQLSGRRLAEKLRRFGLEEINPAQGRILFVLWQEDCLAIRELAKRTSLGKSTLTSMLDRLEGAGYVRRVRSPSDRRVVSVQRTMKDESFRRAFLGLSDEMTDEWYRGFTEEERARFEEFLRRILVNLEAGVPDLE